MSNSTPEPTELVQPRLLVDLGILTAAEDAFLEESWTLASDLTPAQRALARELAGRVFAAGVAHGVQRSRTKNGEVQR